MFVLVHRLLYRGQFRRLPAATVVSSFVKYMRMDSQRSTLPFNWTMRWMLEHQWLWSSRRGLAVRRRSGWQLAPGCAAAHCWRVRYPCSPPRCVVTVRVCYARQPQAWWLQCTLYRGDRIRVRSTASNGIRASCSACRCATLRARHRWCWCGASIPGFDTASTARLLLQHLECVRGACTTVCSWSDFRQSYTITVIIQRLTVNSLRARIT